jgi:hypothetical protein
MTALLRSEQEQPVVNCLKEMIRHYIFVCSTITSTLTCVTTSIQACTEIDGLSEIYEALYAYQEFVNATCFSVCDSNPCQNGGVCVVDILDSSVFTCICPPGYQGDFCSQGRAESYVSFLLSIKLLLHI